MDIPAAGRVVAKEALEHLRLEQGRAEEHEAEQEVKSAGQGEVALLEQAKLDDGIGMVVQFPPRPAPPARRQPTDTKRR